MADVTVKSVEEMEGIFGGAMRRVRASLGLTSFGIFARVGASENRKIVPGAEGAPALRRSDAGHRVRRSRIHRARGGGATAAARLSTTIVSLGGHAAAAVTV